MTTGEIEIDVLPTGPRPMGLIALQRHPQGPRVFVLGRRVHEYVLGGVILCLALAAHLVGLEHHSVVLMVATALGVWLVAKDWRDIFPSKRDTASWRLGIHRRATPLRRVRKSESLPSVAALLTLSVAIVNLVSALTANVPSRTRVLVQVEPLSALPVFHALALPAAAALAVVAASLARRRRRALHVAILLLIALGVADLLKGLDIEEATVTFGLAALLWWGRGAFCVAPAPFVLGGRLRVVLATALILATTVIVSVGVAMPDGTADPAIVREAAVLVTSSSGAVPLRDEFGWLRLELGLMGFVALVGGTSLLLRPRRPVPGQARAHDRATALRLVRAHGTDTLAFFKLRRDASLFIAEHRDAFLAYRVTNGVLLISGDPVGPPDALPALLRQLCSFAERTGLTIGAVGVGRDLLPLYRDAGLLPFYLGDEAIVDTRAFSLEGRGIRKVRQSMHRLENAGFTTVIHAVGDLDAVTKTELDTALADWRGDEPERGFSMAMDSLAGEHQAETIVVLTRDARGTLRGLLHFVPTFDRPAMSLSLMRRDRSAPNGLMEYAVVRSIELLRDRGVEEISLNFAAFARVLSNPIGLRDRSLARLIRLGNPYFQIESLYRFNAKFGPRWEPRYLLYEHALGLPRIGIAALRVEGLLPEIRVAGALARLGRAPIAPAAS